MEIFRQVYKSQGQEHITILASNFNLQTGGKIPSDVASKVEAQLKSENITGQVQFMSSEDLSYSPLVGISHEMEAYRVQCVCSPTYHDQPADDSEAEGPKFGRKYYLTRCDSSSNVSMDAECGSTF